METGRRELLLRFFVVALSLDDEHVGGGQQHSFPAELFAMEAVKLFFNH